MNQNQLEYLNEIDRPKSRVLLVWGKCCTHISNKLRSDAYIKADGPKTVLSEPPPECY